jgi:hypothetical protein
MVEEEFTMYHLVTFLRFEDGHLAVRLGRMNGALRVWDPKTRQFQYVDILGRFELPQAMTSKVALDWVNQHLSLIGKKFPNIEEFRQ